MIDLHTHTKFSDGENSLISVLKMAEKLGLRALSITDHNTVEHLKKLDTFNFKRYFSGKILRGVEIHCTFNGAVIELLGYGIKQELLEKFLEEHFSKKILQKQSQQRLHHLKSVCDKIGIKYDDSFNAKNLLKFGISGGFFYRAIRKYEENKKFFSSVVWNDYTRFARTLFSNPDSAFYYDLKKEFPTAEEVANAIHNAGGKAVFAHPFIYNLQKNAINAENEIEIVLYFAKQLIKKAKLDGIECYYSKFTPNQTDALTDFAQKNNLIMTGGSDFHGKSRGWQMGTGLNNLNIPDVLLEQFSKNNFVLPNIKYKIISYDKKFDNDILQLINKINIEEYNRAYKPRPDLENIEENYLKNGNFYLAINEKDELVGFIATQLKDNYNSVAKRFYIRKDYRASGLSIKLFNKIIEFNYKKGHKKIYFGCLDNRIGALKMYENYGFIKIAHENLPVKLNGDDVYYEGDIQILYEKHIRPNSLNKGL